ncbi:Uncharacterised protein [Sphingobacterium daejeonense]|nr:Uncharacterised protein [Sphingobacterium daejeonense]
MPSRFAVSDFFVGYFQVDTVVDSVNLDDIIILYQSDQSSFVSFWSNMSYDEAMRSPEKRPSVIRATELPKPAPIINEVGFNISGIPGAPLGPSFLITTHHLS